MSIINNVFTEGWEFIVLSYGTVFLLARHSVYKIIFRPLIGEPESYRYEDQKQWYRKASFSGAVIFAPLFEEIMFTYLAYANFLHYAHIGKEGLVVLFVATFFALLHLPGDLRQMSRYRLDNQAIYLLIRFQFNRFFYSLAAYFIYKLTGQLWVTITLHYFFNAIVSFYNFDLEDQTFPYEKGDGRLLLIRLLNVGFALSANYFFYQQYPQLGLYLVPLTGFIVFDFIKR